MDILGQSSLLVAVTSFAYGFSVLARNVRNKLYLSFVVVCTLISGWAMAFFLNRVWPGSGYYKVHLFFNILLAPGSLAMLHVMMRLSDSASRRILKMSVVFAFALSAALLLGLEKFRGVLEMIYFMPAFIVVQITRLMWNNLLSHSSLQGEDANTIPVAASTEQPHPRGIYLGTYVGALIVLGISTMDHVPMIGKVIPSLGNLALSAYLFFLTKAITHQRLLNISALLSRFIVLLVVALTLTIIYATLVVWLDKSLSLFFLNSFIISFLMLMLLEPLRDMVNYFTERLLTQKHRKLQVTLREAERKLTGIVDLEALFDAIFQTIEQTLQPERGSLFILKGDGTQFHRVRTIGRENGRENGQSNIDGEMFHEILAKNLIIEHCEGLVDRGQFPILLDQILENEVDRSASRSEREYCTRLIEGLRAFGANVLIPLVSSRRILGFITLRIFAPPAAWENNWAILPIIYPYFELAAQTMQNMEIYLRQQEKERLAALGEMAAGLAHEIRNPLGAIKGAAQYLDPSAERPESRFLRIIIEEVDRLNRVVSQFLDYSKPFSTQLTPVSLNRLVERTLEMMRPGIDPRIRLDYDRNSRLEGVQIMASAEQIQQVLINLIQNAQQALKNKESGFIRVGLLVSSQAKQIVLSVEDNGHGVRKENLDKLFIPFFTTSPSGTGLGLSICHKIIEAHRGRIEVSSEEGRFARFSVVLPVFKEL